MTATEQDASTFCSNMAWGPGRPATARARRRRRRGRGARAIGDMLDARGALVLISERIGLARGARARDGLGPAPARGPRGDARRSRSSGGGHDAARRCSRATAPARCTGGAAPRRRGSRARGRAHARARRVRGALEGAVAAASGDWARCTPSCASTRGTAAPRRRGTGSTRAAARSISDEFHVAYARRCGGASRYRGGLAPL